MQAKPTHISGAVLDGKVLDYAGVLRLEKMPTKLELIATIARLIKQVNIPRPSPKSWQQADLCRHTVPLARFFAACDTAVRVSRCRPSSPPCR